MRGQGDATSHVKGIGSIGNKHSENPYAQVAPSGELLAFFTHIAPTWLE